VVQLLGADQNTPAEQFFSRPFLLISKRFAVVDQADRDTIIIPDAPCNLLDPSSNDGLSAKMGLDATRKFDEDVKPLKFSPEVLNSISTILKSI
jgi:3-polyprenyl-4-hydroxybenzoate decarboxylase